jgi:hypothetical protein
MISPEDKIYYQDDKNNNYTIIIKKSELDDLIFALNIIINDLKDNQNRQYIINEVENIIMKLKNADIPPPEKDFESAPTFTTVDLENDGNLDKKSSYSPLKPGLSGTQIDNNTYCTYCTDILPDRNNNKEKYEGPIINGKKEGKGIYIYKNGCKYEGYFRNDKKEGEGIFYYANGDRYKGNFSGGFYQGYGVFYFNNGDRYEGEFNKNKYSGKGKYFYHNGDIFEGQWLDDKKQGQGIYIYLNGDKIVGNYNGGKPVGTHFKYAKNGGVFQINYPKA